MLKPKRQKRSFLNFDFAMTPFQSLLQHMGLQFAAKRNDDVQGTTFSPNPTYAYQCLDDVEEPKYGFRTLITYVDQQPCVLDLTCSANGAKIHRPSSLKVHSTTNGNAEYRKRSKRSDFVPSKKIPWTDMPSFKSLIRESRQTGEKIKSDQPSCRLIADPTGNSCLNIV